MGDFTGTTVLSIIMITVPERKKQFKKLKKKVQDQIDYCHLIHPSLGYIEIVEIKTVKYKDGGLSIGNKRQLGLEIAKGEYVMWLDDDDDISPDYVETVTRLANKGADVCTFSSYCKFDNFWMIARMHLNNKLDDQAKPGIINRRPYHVCAFRKGVCEGARFPDQNWDEDTSFISQVLSKCMTFAHSDSILHQYDRTTKSIAEESHEKLA